MIARLFLRLRIGMTSLAFLGCVLPIAACNGGGGGDDATDADGDGFGASSDCNDDDASIHPYADEHCNAIDDDCDGDVDEGVLLRFYLDADNDTYGSGDAEMVEACTKIAGAVNNRLDCDDSDSEVHPGADEICANGTDEDCDGQDLEAYTWYADADGDGYGDPATADEWCDARSGFIADSSDCDDGDAAVHPGVEERCDNAIDDDCDDVVASSDDADADGWYADACVGGDDCDDGDAAIRPDAYELCEDEIDSDCDGMKDDCMVPIFSLSDADAEYTGESSGDAAGSSVAGAGDVNHDGYSDVLVGAPTLGAAYLVLGGPSPASGSLSDADAKYTGAAKGDGAGWSVAGVGDVDGDSYDDMLIGAPNGDAGAAYLVLGPSTASAPLSDADAVYTGEDTYDWAGYSVAHAGDVDGDKCPDMLVGAYGNDAGGVEAGRAYLILGCSSLGEESLSDADAVYTGAGGPALGAGDWVGVSVAGVGDMNGDGYGDILVGADEDGHSFGGDIGYVCILLGDPLPASAALSWGGASLTGSSSGSLAGYSVAGAGDVDDDGYLDVLVGAPGDSGKTYLMLGDATIGAGGEATYTDVSDGAGSSVAGAGDADGDGFADLLIGAPGGDGAAYLVFGSAAPASEALVDVDRKYIGEAADDGAGRSVAGVGDFDLDGYDDFFVGASSNDDGGTDAGAVYLLRGGL